jgi:hypothetical protein
VLSDANGEFQLYSAGSLRFRASSHRSGSSGLFTILRVKRFASMCGGSAFMTAACGGAVTNVCSAASSSQTDSVQNRLAANCARNESPIKPELARSCRRMRAVRIGNQGMRQMLRSGKYESSATHSRPGAARACDCHGDSDISHAAGRRGTAVSEVDSLMLARLRGIAGAMIVLSRESTTGEARDRRVRPRYLLWPGTIAKIIGLLTLFVAGLIVHGLPWSHWDGFHELALGFAAAVFAAVVVGRRLRHAFIVVASVVLCLAVAEAYALVVSAPAIETRAPGFSLPHPVLGWGPGHPGVFHDRSLDGKTGASSTMLAIQSTSTATAR